MEHDHTLCPKFETAFNLLGKRWNGLIIRALMEGPSRFKEISDLIPGMSDRMLAERFKELEAAGILIRRVFPETPVRIEYELTDKGRALEPIMNEVQHWADKWVDHNPTT
ncbi:winged helix-turn-helix transcriptional regulator [Tumebacillus flagellatus]|uniref:HxlR family transcriptional regulator n=1 Tax=Tumebacillus flagellatus TaxID=1157490 RepID=A0A074M5S4_9BACL|nr:HxlR family transcriptional regulator [Tumebacillus flagellatus]